MYANGRIPLILLVHLGGDHYLPPGTAARWKWLQRIAWEKYGVWLVITPGWNAYRPYDVQVDYKRRLGSLAAAAGFSTHGGFVKGQVVFAIDVHNWAALGWARFSALCRLAGFTVNFVSPEELWHIGDFNDGWVVPAGAGSTPVINKDTTRQVEPAEEEDDDMPKNSGFIYRAATQKADQRTVLICNYGSGIFHEYTNGVSAGDSAYNASIAKAFDIPGPFAEISESHAISIKKSLKS